ncbi:FecR family protein [Mucilaginibacter sp. UR6-11]|uniref:FecR family protein n=1 Tax=Mucilaginibacter sp. UR6-11 TaxID=1435644 RepID=UPI001E60E8C6|nr:FecR family protein [Mucilaginibacter sp. UR6-11]MCC8424904.1 FecR family protein [Mucilaginibacter sp. UR6-11]
MSTNELKRLAQKYFAGTASAEEKQMLHQWYDETNYGWVEAVNNNSPETEEQVKQRIFSDLQKRIALEKEIEPPIIRRKFNFKRLAWQTASIAAIFIAGFFALRPADKPLIAEKHYVVNAPLNKVISVILPDGSKVWLNSGSIFKYPKHFTGKVREVELVEGRAFFDVRHMDHLPFIVKTKNLNVTVLGTSFDVRSYKREGTTKVSVVTGKVGITIPCQPTKPAIMLVAHEEVIINPATKYVVKEPVRENVVNLWCKNVLVFDQENLNNVFRAIEKKYNTKITVEDKNLLNERISITLGNQRLDTIMEILSFTKHFNYKMANDSTVVVK